MFLNIAIIAIYRATGLEPEMYYMFSVTAQTRLGWGKTAYALVFTTNNRERPQAPSVPQVSKSQIQSRQITFSWTPGRDGFAPLRYKHLFCVKFNFCFFNLN
ncbi:hypothetical protein P5V15_010401 [Pogonomyrmex californicus]